MRSRRNADEVEMALLRFSKECLAGHGAESGAAASEARARAGANPAFALEVLKLRRAGDARVAAGAPRRRIGGRVAVADKDELTDKIMKLVRAVKKRTQEEE